MGIIVKMLLMGVFLVFGGCTDSPAPSVSHPHVNKARTVKPSAGPEEATAEESVVAFEYNPVGKRDPFESLLKKETEALKTRVPRTPLEKFDLGQFRIQAILVGKGAPRAMVGAPDGKNYILKPGLKIGKNNGVIKNITPAAVLVEEHSTDLSGKEVRVVRSLAIPIQK